MSETPKMMSDERFEELRHECTVNRHRLGAWVWELFEHVDAQAEALDRERVLHKAAAEDHTTLKRLYPEQADGGEP